MKKIIKILLLVFIAAVFPLALGACGNTPSAPELVSIEFYKYPTKQSGYKAFDTFDDGGLQLKATYSDGSFVILNDGWTISYLSADSALQPSHTDCFYGGEDSVKIKYQNKSITLRLLDDVKKINRGVSAILEEYSQIKTDNIKEFPADNIKIMDSQAQSISLDYEIVYCTSFEDYENYEPTTTQDGATTEGGVPTNAGTYKVFAKVFGDKNYDDVLSNVVEFNIVSQDSIDLFAKEGEEFFAFKEVFDVAPENPVYIEFEMSEINEVLYFSTFAGNGKAMIFADHITLVSEDEKTQIIYENDEILLQNGEKTLKKWVIPSFIGIYEMTITPEMAAGHMEISENQTCTLEIYYDKNDKDGKIMFTLNCIWFLPHGNSDMWERVQYEGVASYSPSTKRLSFDLLNRTNLFAIQCESSVIQLENILVNIPGAGNELSNGEYVRV